MALMGNSSCFTSLEAYHVLWPCFKAIFLFIQKFLQYITYIEFASSTILLHPSLPHIPGIVSTDNIFPFTYMCTQYLHHIYLPSPFSHLLPPSTGTNLSTPQDLFHPPCSPILYKKRITFLVVSDSLRAIWHCWFVVSIAVFQGSYMWSFLVAVALCIIA
jgi:hypothetical protein